MLKLLLNIYLLSWICFLMWYLLAINFEMRTYCPSESFRWNQPYEAHCNGKYGYYRVHFVKWLFNQPIKSKEIDVGLRRSWGFYTIHLSIVFWLIRSQHLGHNFKNAYRTIPWKDINQLYQSQLQCYFNKTNTWKTTKLIARKGVINLQFQSKSSKSIIYLMTKLSCTYIVFFNCNVCDNFW